MKASAIAEQQIRSVNSQQSIPTDTIDSLVENLNLQLGHPNSNTSRELQPLASSPLESQPSSTRALLSDLASACSALKAASKRKYGDFESRWEQHRRCIERARAGDAL